MWNLSKGLRMDQSRNSIFSDSYSTPPQPRKADATEPREARLNRRKFDILYLDRAGHLCEQSLLAAAHPAFEAAFSVAKQGSLVQSERGIVAVEDVFPGDRLRLSNGAFEVVQWRGSMVVNADEIAANSPSAQMTRITGDAFGFSRPTTDLVLGHGARILHRAAGIRKVSGNDSAFIPAADFVDGNNLIAMRPTGQFSMFQFGFHGQRGYEVNGITIESLHPGTAFNLGLRGDSLRAFLTLFPHKSSFEEFGLLHIPRLRLRDLDLLG